MSSSNRRTTSDRWMLSALLARAGIGAEGACPAADVTIKSLTDDSRAVTPGACFIAVRGQACDGHRFVESAVQNGAVAVVVERDVCVPVGTPVVRVDDTRVALAKLAAGFYGLIPAEASGLRLIGITGTNGKTTVAWLLRSILQAAGHRIAMMGTIEYDLAGERCDARLTTPGALDLCRHLSSAQEAGADYGVLEVSSHALDQRRTDGLTFTAGVFTNLSGDHLDYHETMPAYLAAKRRLFERLPADAIAVISADDPCGDKIARASSAPVITFGLDSRRADVTARIQEMTLRQSVFVLEGRGFEGDVRLPLPGGHNVLNALAAAATAEALGIGWDAIRDGIERIGTIPGRLQHAAPDDCPFSVLVDYAHTDDALDSVLEALRPLIGGRLLCVFGCGGDRDRTKRPRMAAAVARHADVAYVTSDNPRTEDPMGIIEDILPGFGPGFSLPDTTATRAGEVVETRAPLHDIPRCRVETYVDRRTAIDAAIAEARPGDTVLIAGKGHETYQLVGNRVLPFDDVEVARSCIGRHTVVAEDAA